MLLPLLAGTAILLQRLRTGATSRAAFNSPSGPGHGDDYTAQEGASAGYKRQTWTSARPAWTDSRLFHSLRSQLESGHEWRILRKPTQALRSSHSRTNDRALTYPAVRLLPVCRVALPLPRIPRASQCGLQSVLPPSLVVFVAAHAQQWEACAHGDNPARDSRRRPRRRERPPLSWRPQRGGGGGCGHTAAAVRGA